MEFFEIAQWGITGSTRNVVADNMCLQAFHHSENNHQQGAWERLISLEMKKKAQYHPIN